MRGYRGGYLPNRRREIEKGLRDGEVRGVVATNALELGIDIGALDVAVLAGYPGTSRRRGSGPGARAAGRDDGRGAGGPQRPAGPVRGAQPGVLLRRLARAALINPDNLQILLAHIKCAAFELPFGTTEVFGRESVQDILQILSEEGLVHLAEGQTPGEEAHWHWTNESYPADAMACGPCRRTTSSSWTTPTRRASSAKPISPARPPPCTKKPSTSSGAGSTRWSGSTSTTARRTSGRSSAITTRSNAYEGHDP